MEKPLAFVFIVLSLVLVGLVFREHSIVLGQQRTLDSNTEERNSLAERVATLEKERDALASQLSGAENRRMPPQAGSVMRGPGKAVQTFEAAVPAGTVGGPMAAMDSPEMRKLMAIQQRSRLDARYAALFKALGLPPAKLEQLKQLLVDKQNAAADVLAAARKQSLLGTGNGGEIHALMDQEKLALDNSIRDLLGDAAYQQYQQYDQTRAERSLIDQLNSRLSYTDTPLTADQSDDLLELLAAGRKPEDPAANSGDGRRVQFTMVGTGGDTTVSYSTPGSTTPISDDAIEQSEDILSPAQIAALRELQAEQRAQQQMSELLRQSLPSPGQGGHMIIATPPVGAMSVGG